MANLKEIRGRIASVKNTRKITSAMGRIASARLRKAQNMRAAANPYGTRVREVVGELIAELQDDSSDKLVHPLLRKAEKVERVALIVVTADRGLCGGFNANVSRCAWLHIDALRAEGKTVEIYCVGRKGGVFLRHRGYEVQKVFAAPGLDDVIPKANEVAAALSDRFLADELDAVEIVYNHFVNVIAQEPRVAPILPVPPVKQAAETTRTSQRLFEPSREAMLDALLPMAVQTSIQTVYFDSVACEVASRRTAMDNATDNASELIGELTLQYNRERQAAITTELTEIVSGAEALKG